MAILTTPTANSVIPIAAASINIGTAGGTITIGHPLYFDSTTNTWIEANANSSGSVTVATATGWACNSCIISQKVMVLVNDAALATGFTAAEIYPGMPVYLNDTAGFYCTDPATDLDAGDWVTYIGQINNPEKTMNFAPKAPILKA